MVQRCSVQGETGLVFHTYCSVFCRLNYVWVRKVVRVGGDCKEKNTDVVHVMVVNYS